MYWSYSTSKMFRRCQRQWFYYDRFASALATKDPLRSYAFALKKLTTVSQWRGMLVDGIVSELLVPGLKDGRSPSLQVLKREAAGRYERQLACARKHPITDRAVRPRDFPDFAIFHCQEYGPGLDAAELAQARADLDRALENLFSLTALRDEIKSAQHRAAQRMIRMPINGMTAKGVPDLVLYPREGMPTIIDWKVHALGEIDAWRQLGIYAILLAHDRRGTKPEDIRLLEVQLLVGEVREYRLDADDVQELEEGMAVSAEAIRLAAEAAGEDELDPTAYPRATHAETCRHCAFLRLCWSTDAQPKSPPWP